MTQVKADVVVIGAGLIGLSTARALVDRLPGLALAVVDKEPGIAAHQSSHNSGVVHSGIYYKPGSLKARLCIEGRDAVYSMCEERDIPHRRSGKLVIATDHGQIPALDELERRGLANGLNTLRRLSADEISAVEPSASGVDALWVAESGVVDFPALAGVLAEDLASHGAEIHTGIEVAGIVGGIDRISIDAGPIRFVAKALVNCAGLQSDLVATMAGVTPTVRIVPFRGEYYQLSDAAAHLVKGLIYPVPDPRLPFLGVHFTRRVDGTVEVGPNAVLSSGRETYRRGSIDWRELKSIVGYAGFRRLALRHWAAGLRELVRSRSRSLYAREARKLIPAIGAGDLQPGKTGIRAQALDAGGNLVDDFVIEAAGRSVHVLNAPSPGATASLAIGRHVSVMVERVLRSR